MEILEMDAGGLPPPPPVPEGAVPTKVAANKE